MDQNGSYMEYLWILNIRSTRSQRDFQKRSETANLPRLWYYNEVGTIFVQQCSLLPSKPIGPKTFASSAMPHCEERVWANPQSSSELSSAFMWQATESFFVKIRMQGSLQNTAHPTIPIWSPKKDWSTRGSFFSVVPAAVVHIWDILLLQTAKSCL